MVPWGSPERGDLATLEMGFEEFLELHHQGLTLVLTLKYNDDVMITG